MDYKIVWYSFQILCYIQYWHRMQTISRCLRRFLSTLLLVRYGLHFCGQTMQCFTLRPCFGSNRLWRKGTRGRRQKQCFIFPCGKSQETAETLTKTLNKISKIFQLCIHCIHLRTFGVWPTSESCAMENGTVAFCIEIIKPMVWRCLKMVRWAQFHSFHQDLIADGQPLRGTLLCLAMKFGTLAKPFRLACVQSVSLEAWERHSCGPCCSTSMAVSPAIHQNIDEIQDRLVAWLVEGSHQMTFWSLLILKFHWTLVSITMFKASSLPHSDQQPDWPRSLWRASPPANCFLRSDTQQLLRVWDVEVCSCCWR